MKMTKLAKKKRGTKGKSAGPKRVAKASSSGTRPARSGSRWTFLTNHAHVLILLHADPYLVLREVAQRVGIT